MVGGQAMTVSMFDPIMAAGRRFSEHQVSHPYPHAPSRPDSHPRPVAVATPRPPVSIERLPPRRPTNEPRELMNCKSCRKRKIKCNKLRPSCEACQVFQCPCIYDAVPKKRGPKSDVLEALLKRVDGLEAQLKDSKSGEQKKQEARDWQGQGQGQHEFAYGDQPSPKRVGVDTGRATPSPVSSAVRGSPTSVESDLPMAAAEFEIGALLDAYFGRFHGKPFYIVDESLIRRRLDPNQVPVPAFLINAICAVAARHVPHPHGFQAGSESSEEFAIRARAEINTDESSIHALQALLLLVLAAMASGKGKRAYMLMTNTVGMAMALELHREGEADHDHLAIGPAERETRRRLFWTCYLLDRLIATGTKRPSLIDDNAIMLQLPGRHAEEGHRYFGALVEVGRILGLVNRYLTAGGYKTEPCFPWDDLSTVAKIRSDLDAWPSGAAGHDAFCVTTGPEPLGGADSTILQVARLMYHLAHCLLYRPFLPVHLDELAATGAGAGSRSEEQPQGMQRMCHQAWRIDAVNSCFEHANAIADMVELGRQAGVEWPGLFVGYCLATAGTVHTHGVHYGRMGKAADAIPHCVAAADYLSRDLDHLAELRRTWACVQHQHNTLRGVCVAHSELVGRRRHAGDTCRNQTGLTILPDADDFFSRYLSIGGPGGPSFRFETALLSLSDVVAVDPPPPQQRPASERRGLKRKNTGQVIQCVVANAAPGAAAAAAAAAAAFAMPTPSSSRRHSFLHLPPGMMYHSHAAEPQHMPQQHGRRHLIEEEEEERVSSATGPAAEAAGFPISPCMSSGGGGGAPFTPPPSCFLPSPASSSTGSCLSPVMMIKTESSDQGFAPAVQMAHHHHHGNGAGPRHQMFGNTAAAAACAWPQQQAGGGGHHHHNHSVVATDPFFTLFQQLTEADQSSLHAVHHGGFEFLGGGCSA